RQVRQAEGGAAVRAAGQGRVRRGEGLEDVRYWSGADGGIDADRLFRDDRCEGVGEVQGRSRRRQVRWGKVAKGGRAAARRRAVGDLASARRRGGDARVVESGEEVTATC